MEITTWTLTIVTFLLGFYLRSPIKPSKFKKKLRNIRKILKYPLAFPKPAEKIINNFGGVKPLSGKEISHRNTPEYEGEKAMEETLDDLAPSHPLI